MVSKIFGSVASRLILTLHLPPDFLEIIISTVVFIGLKGVKLNA